MPRSKEKMMWILWPGKYQMHMDLQERGLSCTAIGRGEESLFCPFYNNKTSFHWISYGFNWIVCYC